MNKTAKKVFRVLGVIASILLSIVFVAMLIATPIYSAAVSMLTPRNITEIIRNIDYVELLLENEEVMDAVGDAIEDSTGIKSEIKTYVEPIMESGIAEEIVTIYVEDITAIIDGDVTEYTINKQTLTGLVDKHMDEIVDLVEENAPEGTVIPKEEIKKTVNETVDTYGEQLIEAMPKPKEVYSMAQEIKKETPIIMLASGSVSYILYGIIALLAVLIFFCLFGGGRGFLCIGIDALIAALFLFAFAALINGSGLLVELLGSIPGIEELLTPIISLFLSNTMTAAIIVAIAGVLSIVAYILCIIYKSKRAAAKGENLPQITV